MKSKVDVCKVRTLDNPVVGRTPFIPKNIRFGREEDLSFPECDRSQPEQHYPYCHHQDGHDGVQDKKSWNLQGVTENAKTRDPAHVRERQGPAYVPRRIKIVQSQEDRRK